MRRKEIAFKDGEVFETRNTLHEVNTDVPTETDGAISCRRQGRIDTRRPCFQYGKTPSSRHITPHVFARVTLRDLRVFVPESAAEGFAENAPNMDRMSERPATASNVIFGGRKSRLGNAREL